MKPLKTILESIQKTQQNPHQMHTVKHFMWHYVKMNQAINDLEAHEQGVASDKQAKHAEQKLNHHHNEIKKHYGAAGSEVAHNCLAEYPYNHDRAEKDIQSIHKQHGLQSLKNMKVK